MSNLFRRNQEVQTIKRRDEIMENQSFQQWCIVELFGHNRLIGEVSKATIGGCSFIRVDVPDTKKKKGFTKYYGNGAIYGMTPIQEQDARDLLEEMQPNPVNAYEFPRLTKAEAQEEDWYAK